MRKCPKCHGSRRVTVVTKLPSEMSARALDAGAIEEEIKIPCGHCNETGEVEGYPETRDELLDAITIVAGRSDYGNTDQIWDAIILLRDAVAAEPIPPLAVEEPQEVHLSAGEYAKQMSLSFGAGCEATRLWAASVVRDWRKTFHPNFFGAGALEKLALEILGGSQAEVLKPKEA